ncbi:MULTISPECIES: pyridoxal kinase PdxY [unclassified Tessaracoccus]|uniref:pyridoxal kinase PdxY n=1 Tax=unclassified Tessaracoccus TaxID=2635419 RepID=UPI00096CF0D6|nr:MULTISPECIES: pyridoxal kinase PdxY [unclassified Tessaracoccus]MBB1509228.1 pyridoxal kinase PdxY [Tessaracoccus sp. MC1756]MCG6566495.1 pyridoxal kinase PdxY [Tessaracoccus sp. ZS01]OMG58938.1 pyridoxal kinase [Tessaracoccus sp. ZS01]
MTTVLSIQSAVAYGHAGNSSAVFPLQRLGVDVWPVHTVNFSNHTGYGSWRGPLIPAGDVWEVVQGINDRGVLGRVDALLCGYMGAPEVGKVILDAGALIKEQNPEALFCADPVMGDVGRGFYARPGIPEFWRDHVVGAVDIMTPNLFELEFLTGRRTTSMAGVIEAAQELRARGPRVVVVTSVVGADASADVMRMVAVDDSGAWEVTTPVIDRTFTGSGDLTTAVFLAKWLKTQDSGDALGQTASVVYSVLEATAAADHAELRLVAAQNDLVDPRFVFMATRL